MLIAWGTTKDVQQVVGVALTAPAFSGRLSWGLFQFQQQLQGLADNICDSALDLKDMIQLVRRTWKRHETNLNSAEPLEKQEVGRGIDPVNRYLGHWGKSEEDYSIIWINMIDIFLWIQSWLFFSVFMLKRTREAGNGKGQHRQTWKKNKKKLIRTTYTTESFRVIGLQELARSTWTGQTRLLLPHAMISPL